MTKIPRSAFVSDRPAPRYFSIDPGRPFLADLAQGLIAAFGEDLARAEIFLPTRRAVRALADAILDAHAATGVRAALLPRLRAIGDIDQDDFDIFAGDAADAIDLAPAISGTARTLALAQLVAAKEKAFAGQENWPAALAAARELGKLLDSLYAEESDPSRLTRIDVGDLAHHWKVSRDFLEIVTTAWPAYLASQDLLDPADRRARLIGAKALRLAKTPPAYPVIIAGTTASAPSVARLLKAIASCPRGAAILPGLDRSLDAKAFKLMEDAHPQAGLKDLLAAIDRAPGDIAAWPASGGPASGGPASGGPENKKHGSRAALFSLALRPADATDEWLALIAQATARDPELAAACEGLELVEADTEDAEAAIIAMMFRETLESAAATAMLVTPDRNLARRVALKMRRWNVIVDDSGGVPFANTPCGTFLRLVAGFLADPGDPVSMLAMLRHPLARLDPDDATRARGVDALDRALRGPRLADNLEDLAAALRERHAPDMASDTPEARVLARLLEAAGRFGQSEGGAFSAALRALLGAAEHLAGGNGLWSGDDGEAGALLLAGMLENADALDAIRAGAFGEVFEALIAGAVVRRRSDAHPRLSILGPLEARLIGADHVILGGLNEGVWPAEAPADPFLSRAMRESVGLPSPERRIGLAAHDFAQGASNPRVTLIRARRARSAPARPSRWIVRLRNILKGAGALGRIDRSALWRGRAERLDAPATVNPVTAPRPRAGKDRRPATLSVTDIETWIRDPYAIYPKRLLGLRKLGEPGEAVGAREAGSLLHKVFERAGRAPQALTAASLRALLDEEAPRAGFTGAERAFWSGAFEEALDWFATFDASRRREGAAHVEQTGSLTLAGVDPPFTLTARADRIDILAGGGASIIDFKTGEVPREKQDKYFSPQLPLTGVIVEAGGFADIGAAPVAGYRYIKVTNRHEQEAKNELARDGDEAKAAILDAEHRLRAWIAHFDRADAYYLSQPRAQFVRFEGDYGQLARRREWMASEDADADGGGE